MKLQRKWNRLEEAIIFMLQQYEKNPKGFLKPLRVMTNLINKYPLLEIDYYIASLLYELPLSSSLLYDKFGYRVMSIYLLLYTEEFYFSEDYLSKVKTDSNACKIRIEDLLDESLNQIRKKEDPLNTIFHYKTVIDSLKETFSENCSYEV